MPGDIAGLTEIGRAPQAAGCTRSSGSSRSPSRPPRRRDYADEFEQILHERTETAVGTKSILAYRGGFERRPVRADRAPRSPRRRPAGATAAGVRLTDRVLLRFGLHEALRLGKPLQFHVGLGDRDCDLHRTNPMQLLDFLRQSGHTPIVLLHCYPYEREAGYLAQAFNNVYLDGGLSINYLGARAPAFIARLLELAPFRKILYSSDAFGPAELHYLGAALWRKGIPVYCGASSSRASGARPTRSGWST